jgi:replicative DNA helicase
VNELFSYDAEVAVLNILLNNPDLVEAVQLKPFMFSAASNSLVFECMYDLQIQGYVPDYTLTLNRLISQSKLEQSGGEEYLKHLHSSEAFNKENLPEFAKQISDSFKARSWLSTSNELVAKIKTGKSIDEVLLDAEHKLSALQENSSMDTVMDMSSAAKETWELLKFRLENPGLTGIPTGLDDLDLLTGGFNRGKLWIIAGRPGMGKTADMCNSVLASAKALLEKGEGEHILVFSLEMDREELINRMLAIHTGIQLQDILFGTISQAEVTQIKDTIKYLSTLPILIDDKPSTDEIRFLSVSRRYHRTKKIRLIYVDYLQLGTERDEGQTMALGRFSRAGKILAKEIGSTNIFYSQLNRSVESRDDKRPQLSDLRQSGSLEEDADIVKFLYRDEYYVPDSKYKGILEQLLKKHRNGKTGMFTSRFSGETMRITNDR